MAFLTPDQSIAVRKLKVGAALFITFDFKSGPLRVWSGDGKLFRDGFWWEGYYNSPIVSVDTIEGSRDGENRTLQLKVSGIDTRIINAALDDDANNEIENRKISFQIGFSTDEVTFSALGPLLYLNRFIMQRPQFDYSSYGDRTISMDCQSIFVQRDRAVLAMLSDRDQNRRFPGDQALKFMILLKDRNVPWPRY
jgi:hypothetical protein